MLLSIHWADQALSEVVTAFQAEDEKAWASVVESLIHFMYALEYESGMDEAMAEQHALEVLPQQWHVIIKEAARIKRGEYADTSFFATKKQRSEAAAAFAAYIIRQNNERYGLFS